MQPTGVDRDVPFYTPTLDAGEVSGFLAVRANKPGLYVHGMIGLGFERACADLRVPVGYSGAAA